jgi:TM2 domain-containing membrane protein YozV
MHDQKAKPIPPEPKTPVAVSSTNSSSALGLLERKWLVALVFSIFFGWVGLDAFYLGKTGKGILKMLTFGLFGILWLVDIIMIATKSVSGVVWKDRDPNKSWASEYQAVVVVIVILFIGFIGVAAGGGSGGSGSGGSGNNTATSTPTPAPTPMVVDTNAFADEFDANKVVATDKYKGKLVQLTATISNISDMQISFYNVASKEFSDTQISCNVTDKSQVLSVKNGQSVTVKGTVGSQTFGIIDLNDCSVVK